ncbi:hypothetical protein AB0D27_15115 [Streptomyces sp. NPDC048415]
MTDIRTSDELRNHLVDEIIAERPLPQKVERVMRSVRREAYLPGFDLPAA